MERCAGGILGDSCDFGRPPGRELGYNPREGRTMAKYRLASRVWWFSGLGLLAAAMGASCQASNGVNIFTGDTSNGGSGAGVSNGNGAGSGTDSSGAFMFDAGHHDGDNGDLDGGGCAGEATKAQQLPLDM